MSLFGTQLTFWFLHAENWSKEVMRLIIATVILIVLLSICQLRGPNVTASGTLAVATADSTAAVNTATVVPVQLTYLERKGKRLFLHYCAVCHGETGAGDGFNAYNLNPRPRNLTDPEFLNAVSDAWLAEIIAQGGRGVNKSPLMPTWGNTLNKRQIEALVTFIRTLPGSVEQ
jgi:mono/diheme cytochrome c family protein